MGTDERIVIDVDLSFGDLYKATLRISAYVLRYLIGAVALLLFLFVICAAARFGHASWSVTADTMVQLLYPVVIGAVPTTAIMIPLVAFVRARTYLRTTGDDGKRRYSFSSDAVKIESRLANAEVKWPAYTQVRESGGYFLMYSAPGFANVLPKRNFPDRTSLEGFRALVRANVQKFTLQG